MLKTRKEVLFVSLCGVFITSAIVAELISCKQADIGLYPIIAGIVPWPVVFLLTDVMNEFFGKQTVRRLSWITSALIALCFLLVFVAVELPTAEGSYAKDAEFRKLFGSGLFIMIGSITAFIIGQMVDVRIFWFMRRLTGDRLIWLRSTGSTVISQAVDSFVVALIGLHLSGMMPLSEAMFYAFTGYVTKLVIAVCLTPLIYVVRGLIKRILGEEEAERLSRESAAESLAVKS